MTIDPIAGAEGKKRTDAQDHGAEYFIANVEVVVGVTRPMPPDDAITRLFGRVLRRAGAEVRARYHSFEDEVNAKAFATFHGQEEGAGVHFVPEAFLLRVEVRSRHDHAQLAPEGMQHPLVIARSAH